MKLILNKTSIIGLVFILSMSMCLKKEETSEKSKELKATILNTIKKDVPELQA